MRIATFAAAVLVSCLSSYCHAQFAWTHGDAIVIFGDKGTINDALKSASRDKRMPGAAALLTKNYLSKENPIDLGELNAAGLRIVNELKSTDKDHYYRFSVKVPGSIVVSVSKNARNFEYGIKNLGGGFIASQYAAIGGDLNQFFLPGDYILFVSKLDWTTTYQLSLKLNPE